MTRSFSNWPAPQRSTHCCSTPIHCPWKQVPSFCGQTEPSRTVSSSGHWSDDKREENDTSAEITWNLLAKNCHRTIPAHRKYFERLGMCSLMEAVCNPSSRRQTGIQLHDRIGMFVDCNRLRQRCNSTSTGKVGDPDVFDLLKQVGETICSANSSYGSPSPSSVILLKC